MSLFNFGLCHEIPRMYESLYSRDPQIICLCEEHEIKSNQLANAHLIMRNYREGDVVLVETPETHPYWHSQVKYLPKIVPLFGWEKENARQPIYDLGYKIHLLLDKLDVLDTKIKTADITRIELFNDIQEILSSIPREHQYKAIEILMSNDFEQMFLHKKAIRFYFSSMISKYGQREWDRIAKYDPSRNKAMIEKIEEMKKIYNRVFVIAGQNHFIQEFGSGLELKNYLSSKKFVVLLPNLADESIYAIEKNLKQLRTVRNVIGWLLRWIKYGFYCSPINAPIESHNTCMPSHWHWHPNSWMERSKKIESDEVGDIRGYNDYNALFMSFLKSHRFSIVDTFTHSSFLSSMSSKVV